MALCYIYLAALDTDEEHKTMESIYDEYKGLMLRYSLSIIHDKYLAEDAVHNAFIAIINHKEKIFSLTGRDLKAQIIIITKNKCIDILRQKSRHASTSIDDVEFALEFDDIPIEDKITLNEEYELIRKFIALLDESSRAVLEMKYVQQMSYKEIGTALNITSKHVDTKIMRAKEKVRKLIVSEVTTL